MSMQMWSNMSLVIPFLALDSFSSSPGSWKVKVLGAAITWGKLRLSVLGRKNLIIWIWAAWGYHWTGRWWWFHRVHYCMQVGLTHLGPKRKENIFESGMGFSWLHLWPWGRGRHQACWSLEFHPWLLPVDCSPCLGASSWLILCQL